ncbi:MAG: serine hydrolase domain-containing protein [Chthoniobacterales bacterium]
MKEKFGGVEKKQGASRPFVAAIALLVAGALVVLVWRAAPLLRIATGSVSSSVCAGVFISGLDPEQVYREEQLPNPGIAKLNWALRYTVDRARREVSTTILGRFRSRAVYREGFGCHLVLGDSPLIIDRAIPPVAIPEVEGNVPPLVEAIDPRLSPALDAAFAEIDPRGWRQTKAVVVLRDGKLIAERYAPGYGVNTAIWGHSLTKSVTNALIGILVREGKLKVDEAAPVAAWQSPGDPRRGITLDQLLRMSSGLPPDETNDTITLATRMWFLEPDSVAFAASQRLAAVPGTQWAYSNLGYALLSGVVRDAAGDGEPGRTLAFIQKELFQPVGMQHATLEFDSAGTPEGNGFMFATARDWARFGQLYLDDGLVQGRRILPEGWVKYSVRPTLDTGYGAGFWTNLKKDGEIPYWGIEWGLPSLPTDTYFGRGALGQYIVVVPSKRVVVVRLGLSHDTSTGIGKLAASILETLESEPGELPRSSQ